jgi:hypothetical protein
MRTRILKRIIQNKSSKEYWISRSALIVSVASAGIAVWSVFVLKDSHKAQFRPYVGIENIVIETVSSDGIHCQIALTNTGIVPANNVTIHVVEMYSSIAGQWHKTTKQDSIGIVLPLPSRNYFPLFIDDKVGKLWSEGSLKLDIDFLIQYQGISDDEFRTRLNYRFEPGRFGQNDSFRCIRGSAN